MVNCRESIKVKRAINSPFFILFIEKDVNLNIILKNEDYQLKMMYLC